MSPTDTIAAIATPPGRGGIGVVRVSGPRAEAVLRALVGTLPPSRRAVLRELRDGAGNVLDQGMVVYFPGPASFTGEDVAELHAHGSPVVLDLLLQRCVELGARLARPGEFSERAFLNGKLDLTQAEAIADLIDSVSAQAARCALRSLQGEFSCHIRDLSGRLVYLRTYLEAGIDFPDEELDLLADGQVVRQLLDLEENLKTILARARQGWLLREGMRLVIAGRPNVGKSSLLNALAQRDSAIVAAIPGTTRDIVREIIDLDGMPLHILDTAGLRDTADPVEQEGIRRTHHALQEADLVLFLLDERDARIYSLPPDGGDLGRATNNKALFSPSHPFGHAQDKPTSPPSGKGTVQHDSHSRGALNELLRLVDLPAHCDCLIVANKCDLAGIPAGLGAHGILHISAKTGAGLEVLKQALKAHMGFQEQESGTFLARRRHLDALQRCAAALTAAHAQAETGAAELAAEELRAAHRALGEITGEFTSEDLLASIFNNFCIGK